MNSTISNIDKSPQRPQNLLDILTSSSLSEEENALQLERLIEEAKGIKTSTFADFSLSPVLQESIIKAGFTEPTPIQVQAIPALLAGKDLMGQAPTGSGKTAAYALPALNGLHRKGGVEILVLTPTRELAQQVVEQFQSFARNQRDISVVSIVGGESIRRQVELVQQGAQVAVATPGRLLDQLSSGRLRNFKPHFIVLDEADEMLDMGFIDDLKSIFTFLPEEKQVVLFSATMPDPILKLTKTIQKNPVQLKLNNVNQAHVDIEQRLYVVHPKERETALVRLIDAEKPEKAIVFCRTRRETDELCEGLSLRGIRARGIHGDLNQAARMQAMKEIKSGRINILVGTDVASRGLDINDLTHVFNFHLPESKERYVHRIGRTGRAGKKGIAITLATPGEIRQSYFFREVPIKQFTVSAIPTRDELESKSADWIIEKVGEMPVSPMARRVFEEIAGSDDGELIFSQMVAHMLNENSIQGPNRIGLTVEELQQAMSRPASQSRPRSGGGRGGYGSGTRNRFGGKGGGGYSSRPRRSNGGPNNGGAKSAGKGKRTP